MHFKANSIEELITMSEYSEVMSYIVNLIDVNLGIKPILVNDEKMTSLGYGMFEYKTTTYTKDIAIITVAPQKNNVSIYFMGFIDGVSILSNYSKYYKKSQTSKSCLRISKISDLNDEVFLKICTECLKTLK